MIGHTLGQDVAERDSALRQAQSRRKISISNVSGDELKRLRSIYERLKERLNNGTGRKKFWRAPEADRSTHTQTMSPSIISGREKIYSYPEIHRIDDRLRAQMSELVGLTIKSAARIFSDALKALEDESLALQAKSRLLHAAGYPVDYLEDISLMPEMQGHRIYRKPNVLLPHRGIQPPAHKRAEYASQKKQRRALLKASTFRCTARQGKAMSIVYDTCREYASSFSGDR